MNEYHINVQNVTALGIYNITHKCLSQIHHLVARGIVTLVSMGLFGRALL